MKTIKAPLAQKKYERMYAEASTYMIEQISERFMNQVLKELNQGTIKKFEDAQSGNYASIMLTLSNRVKRKLLKQFDDKRLKTFTASTLLKSDKMSQSVLYASTADVMGIDIKQLLAKDIAKPQVNALILESTQWIKKLRDETLEMYTANTLRAMSNGKTIEDIVKEFKGEAGKRKDHAKFVARNQVASFNAMTNKIRHQKLGITRGIWKTSRDERVRECHKKRNNKEFELSEGLYSSCDQKTLFPGVDYQCRCTYEAILPEIE